VWALAAPGSIRVRRLRGEAVTYSVTLKAIKERKLPELDDEFAKTVAGEETYDALRAAVREDLHQAATNEARNEVLNSIVEKIAEGGTLEVPGPMVDDAVNEEIERLRTRLGYQRTTLEAYLRANQQTEEELRASESAANQVRSDTLAKLGITEPPTVDRMEVTYFEVSAPVGSSEAAE